MQESQTQIRDICWFIWEQIAGLSSMEEIMYRQHGTNLWTDFLKEWCQNEGSRLVSSVGHLDLWHWF